MKRLLTTVFWLALLAPARLEAAVIITPPGVTCAADPRLTAPVAAQDYCFDSSVNALFVWDGSAWVRVTLGGGVTFTNLGTALTGNGAVVYCSDCKVTTGTPGNPSTYTNNTCTSGGNGALAIRLNGVNVCYQ